MRTERTCDSRKELVRHVDLKASFSFGSCQILGNKSRSVYSFLCSENFQNCLFSSLASSRMSSEEVAQVLDNNGSAVTGQPEDHDTAFVDLSKPTGDDTIQAFGRVEAAENEKDSYVASDEFTAVEEVRKFPLSFDLPLLILLYRNRKTAPRQLIIIMVLTTWG